MIACDALAALPGVEHGFLTRRGGVSKGIYASLNCGLGSADSRARVAENRARALAALGQRPKLLCTAVQTHSSRVAVIDRPPAKGERPEADALVTKTPGLALGILAADCAPVLLADAAAGVIGAAHAGWRGALGGVIEAAIEAMATLGAEAGRTTAAIGPCIGKASYEVGPEFPAPFLDADAGNADFFAPASLSGRHCFDLAGFLARRLQKLGIGEIARTAADTCADAARFFSYRRARLHGETDYGRQLSAIALRG